MSVIHHLQERDCCHDNKGKMAEETIQRKQNKTTQHVTLATLLVQHREQKLSRQRA